MKIVAKTLLFDKNISQTLLNQLRADLLEARKAHDQLTTSTLQAIISAIDNAGAVPLPEEITSTEVPRRELSTNDIREIIKREIIELQQAIEEFGDAKSSYIDELHHKIIILEKYL